MESIEPSSKVVNVRLFIAVLPSVSIESLSWVKHLHTLGLTKVHRG
jgi:hypothetical protein